MPLLQILLVLVVVVFCFGWSIATYPCREHSRE